jgi:hypothetical protein
MGFGAYLGRLFSVGEWNIGLAELKLDDLVGARGQDGVSTVTPQVRWMDKPWFVRYQADPCLVESGARLFLFYEELLFGSPKGRLRVVELKADGPSAGRGLVMMSLRYHASYPYVFEHSNTFYCIPETAGRRQVTLYRSDTPQGPWTWERVLLDGVRALDSTAFFFEGRWWLFCTVAGRQSQSRHSNLHIWHAPELRGPWEPHRLQPAKSDIQSARPAGRPFVVNGVLYRPAQDCSSIYGARVVVNRVHQLTPQSFAEEVCSYVEPDPTNLYPAGLHTLSNAGAYLAIDGYREGRTLNPYKLGMAAMAKIRERWESVARKGLS